MSVTIQQYRGKLKIQSISITRTLANSNYFSFPFRVRVTRVLRTVLCKTKKDSSGENRKMLRVPLSRFVAEVES